MDPRIDQESIDARRIEIGTDLEELVLSATGNFLLTVWEQKISLTCADSMLGKRKNDFICKSFDDILVNRGFALGIKWVIDDIKSRINVAKRLIEDKKAQEESEPNRE